MIPFEELQKAVSFVTTKGFSDFYRTLYKMDSNESSKELHSQKDWDGLPFTNKEMLQEIPIKNRLFIPQSKLNSIYVSSGTSGKPPLFSPRQHLSGFDYRKEFCDPQKPLLSSVCHHHYNEHLHPQTIMLNPKHIKASIRLARIMKTEVLKITSQYIQNIGEQMQLEGISNNFRLIDLGGSYLTPQLFNTVKTMFPNASFISTYGASEIECSPVGIPCHPLTGEDPLEVFHANRDIHLEIIDPATEKLLTLKKGVVGELIITSYARPISAFPLIRYRIGDMVQIVEEKCKKHNQWSFTVLGRKDVDLVKIPGGNLQADEILRILRSFNNNITDTFELHYFEQKDGSKIKLGVILYIEPRQASVDLESLARKISSTLMVGPTRTYEDGVLDGNYTPLVCKIIDKKDTISGNRKRIIRVNHS